MMELNQLFEDLAEQVIVQDAAVTAAHDQTQHVVEDTENANVQTSEDAGQEKQMTKDEASETRTTRGDPPETETSADEAPQAETSNSAGSETREVADSRTVVEDATMHDVLGAHAPDQPSIDETEQRIAERIDEEGLKLEEQCAQESQVRLPVQAGAYPSHVAEGSHSSEEDGLAAKGPRAVGIAITNAEAPENA